MLDWYQRASIPSGRGCFSPNDRNERKATLSREAKIRIQLAHQDIRHRSLISHGDGTVSPCKRWLSATASGFHGSDSQKAVTDRLVAETHPARSSESPTYPSSRHRCRVSKSQIAASKCPPIFLPPWCRLWFRSYNCQSPARPRRTGQSCRG
jgi:hypothetical protein